MLKGMAAVDQARKQIAELQAELHELRCRLNRNSSNSSSPPSVDPPGAPKLVVKTPSGRKPGGQPGRIRCQEFRAGWPGTLRSWERGDSNGFAPRCFRTGTELVWRD